MIWTGEFCFFEKRTFTRVGHTGVINYHFKAQHWGVEMLTTSLKLLLKVPFFRVVKNRTVRTLKYESLGYRRLTIYLLVIFNNRTFVNRCILNKFVHRMAKKLRLKRGNICIWKQYFGHCSLIRNKWYLGVHQIDIFVSDICQNQNNTDKTDVLRCSLQKSSFSFMFSLSKITNDTSIFISLQ